MMILNILILPMWFGLLNADDGINYSKAIARFQDDLLSMSDDRGIPPAASIEKAIGGWGFHERGTIYPSTTREVLHFQVNIQELERHVNDFCDHVDVATLQNGPLYKELQHPENFRGHSFHDINQMQQNNCPKMKKNVASLKQLLRDSPHDKRQLAIAGAISGLLFGAYNTYQISQTNHRLDSAIRTLKKVTKSVKTNSDNIWYVKVQLDRQHLYNFHFAITEAYNELENQISIYEKIVGSAIHGNLNQGIQELYDLPGIWEDFKKEQELNGKRPALSHWQLLTNLKSSWWGSSQGNMLHIMVVVPVLDENTQPFTLHQSEPGPIVLNGTVLHLRPRDSFIAQSQKDSRDMISLSDKQLATNCDQIGMAYYCHGSMVEIRGDTFGTCLSSIFTENLEDMSKKCFTDVVPFRNGIWPRHNNSYLVLTDKSMTIFVKCRDQNRDMTLKAQQKGLFTIHLNNNCSAQAEGFKTSIGEEYNNLKEIKIREDQIYHEEQDVSWLDIPASLELDTPQDLQSALDDWDTNFSLANNWTFKHALILSFIGLAFLAIFAVVGFMVFRKKCRPSPTHGQSFEMYPLSRAAQIEDMVIKSNETTIMEGAEQNNNSGEVH